MIDLIKKTVLAGIGATIVTKEKLEVAMQDWVKQGKVTTEEARQFAARLAEDGKKEWETTSAELNDRIKQLIAKADYARRTDVAALELRVKALEEKVEALTRVPAA